MSNDPGNNGQTVAVRFVVETSEAVERAKEMREAVDAVKQKLKEMREAGAPGSFKELGNAFKELSKEALKSASVSKDEQPAIQRQIKATTQAVQELTRAEKGVGDEAKTSSGKAKSAWADLGRALQYTFGLTIYQFISNLIGAIRTLINTAIDYGRVLANLAISTRALQRLGADITFKDVIAQVRALKKEFPIISTKDAAEGVAYIQLLLRNFGATQDQMKKVTELAAGLSVLLGKDLNTSARELALFFSSGYAESLQRAGFAVNRLTVTEEAHRLGIEKSYMAMTEQERFQAAYSLVMGQYANIQGDVNNLVNSQYTSLQKVNTAWQDLINTLSLMLLPLISNIAAGLQGMLGFLQTILVFAIGGYTLLQKLDEMLVKRQGSPQAMREYFAEWKKGISDALQGISDLQKMPFGDLSGSLLGSMGLGEGEGDAEKIADLVNQINDEIKGADEQFKIDMENAEIDYWRDRYQIIVDGQRKSEELWRDHYRKLESISDNARQDNVKAGIKYSQDVADAETDYGNRVAEANEKHRETEIKAERDFQEKMLELREKFMLDLEDAVRIRDARQILQLIRRYNLEKKQQERQYGDTKKTNDEQYQSELAQLARARDEKLAALAIELQRRQEAIAQQVKWETEQENLKYKQETEDQARELSQQLEDRKARWEQQKIDLQKNFDDRFQMYVNDLVRTKDLTAVELGLIGDEYAAVFGKDGRVEVALRNAIAMWNAYYAAMGGSSSSVPSFNYSGQGTYMPSNIPSHASGGTFYANSPQLALWGEVPEIATFTPISQLNANKGASGFGFGKGGKTTIEVLLSPGLEAKVIDDALGQMADVMVKVQRTR